MNKFLIFGVLFAVAAAAPSYHEAHGHSYDVKVHHVHHPQVHHAAPAHYEAPVQHHAYSGERSFWGTV